MKAFQIKCFAIALFLSISTELFSQNASSSSIMHELEKMEFNGSVLYIAAHPDDENTRLISWLTNDLKADVAYLSLTRGGGGQNLIGKEIGEGLGLIRSNELLAARSVDGAKQYFTRAIDFGYSKSPGETFNIWNREAVLGDMVQVIRTMKPDIVITRFSAVENPHRPTHGHHTASAQLAREAVAAAKDSTRFPEQLHNLQTWQVQKLYWNTSWWFYGSKEEMVKKVSEHPDDYVSIDVNTYLPLIGKHCSEIAAESRSQHKSQGFGSSPSVGDQIEYLQWILGENKSSELFSGIKTSWDEVEGGKMVASALKKVMDKFDYKNPSASLLALFELKEQIEKLSDCKWQESSLERLNRIISQCLGSNVQFYSSEQLLSAGEEFEIEFAMSKPNGIEFSLGKIDSKNIEFLDAFKPDFNEGGYTQKLKCRIPLTQNKSQPYWLESTKDIGTYHIKSEDVGKPMNDYPFTVVLDLKVQGKSFKQTVPVVYQKTDPVKGDVKQPLVVHPDVMLNLSSQVLIFPDNSWKEIQIEVVAGKAGMKGYVELNANTGWVVEPAFFECNLSTKGEIRHFTFKIKPPTSSSSSSIRAIFKSEQAVYSTGTFQLKYDHIPNWSYFPTADLEVRRIDLVRKGKTIGYVEGAGDKVAEYLGVMGYDVQIIAGNTIGTANLKAFDAVVVGIRAFNTLENAKELNNALVEYCGLGGTVLVQYNTAHALKVDQIGPYPLKLSRDRVTEESSAVSFLFPNHKVLNAPNKLSSADFEGWVQERGLYFPSEWSDDYSAILGMADQDSEELKGSLLVSKYKEGYFVYSGLSFFRELPAGVSGAYRLLANIIALGED